MNKVAFVGYFMVLSQDVYEQTEKCKEHQSERPGSEPSLKSGAFRIPNSSTDP